MRRPTAVQAAGTALILWAIVLHAVFFASAGGLWRDEVNSVNQANLASWRELGRSLQYDSFPLLYPALLRAWSGMVPPGSDSGLRLSGLAVGLVFVVSLPAAARLAGFSWPVAALLLAAAGPLFIAETDSVRPYGVGFVCLVWAFGCCARSLATESAGWIAATALWCTLAVQTSYSNAAQVGGLALCAAGAACRCRSRAPWRWLLPAAVAAVSLVPYAGVVRRASDWAALVRQPVDWAAFASRFLDLRGFVLFAAPWIVFAIIALMGWRRYPRKQRSSVLRWYFGLLLAAALPAQLLMLELLGVAPFPRYLLPGLLAVAVALDGLAGDAVPRRSFFAVTAALLLALPMWSLLRERRTNADVAGRALSVEAGSRDLVLVSPWFLHPSFQRYYRGPAPWETVPDLPAAPMMRYDLVKRGMLDPATFDRTSDHIHATLAAGGVVWLVTQRQFRSSPGMRKPMRPQPGSSPGGGDYVRFRSYWEDGVEYALASCCAGVELPVARGRPVWDEEDLIVVKWAPRR
jgi:hypothetical protein